MKDQVWRLVKVVAGIECITGGGGKFHSVLKGFEVPKMTLQNFITCWYCGNPKENVPPLRFIKSHDISKSSGKVLVSQWRKMMEYVRRGAIKVGYTIPSNDKIEVKDTVDLYAATKQLFRYKALRVNHKRRYEGLLWKTIFNNISKNQGRFADEVTN